MASWSMARALFPLLLALVAASGPDLDTTEGAMPSDDECGPEGAEGACAVNALQRRAAQQQQGTAEVAPLEAEGEPAAMLEAGVNSSWSCSLYGCQSNYRVGQLCQCSPSCKRYRNCCYDYGKRCGYRAPSPSHGPAPSQGGQAANVGTMTLYHQTSPSACRSILKSGFRIGHGGWCGKGIYFATSPQATKGKAITPHSGIGCMLEVKVKVGKVLKFPCCRYCGGHKDQHVNHNAGELASKGYDSISMNPGDGDEYIIYDPSKVISMRTIPFKSSWKAHRVMHWR